MSARSVLVLLLLTPLLGGCRYNFMPPVPQSAHAPLKLPPRLTGATLTREGDTLLVRATLIGTFEPGYLRAVWFDNSLKLAEDSVYVDPSQREVIFRYDAPARGAYRVTLALGETILRQLELYEIKP